MLWTVLLRRQELSALKAGMRIPGSLSSVLNLYVLVGGEGSRWLKPSQLTFRDVICKSRRKMRPNEFVCRRGKRSTERTSRRMSLSRRSGWGTIPGGRLTARRTCRLLPGQPIPASLPRRWGNCPAGLVAAAQLRENSCEERGLENQSPLPVWTY